MCLCVCVCVCVLYPDEEDVLYQLSDPGDSSDEVLEESYTQVSRKQASQVTHTHTHTFWTCILVRTLIDVQ